MNILKNKASKSCTIPAETIASKKESIKELMLQIVQLSKQVPLADPIRRKQILQCNATILSFFLRSLQHNALAAKTTNLALDNARKLVTSTVGDALQDFLNKRSHLSLLFFETLFTRYPLLCVTFVTLLKKQITEGEVNNYKRLELVALLTCLLQNARSKALPQIFTTVMSYKAELSAVREWAQEKLNNREKEGYEDFRKQPRRKTLNDFCKAWEVLEAAASTEPSEKQKKKEERKKIMKERMKDKKGGKQGGKQGEKKETAIKKEKGPVKKILKSN